MAGKFGVILAVFLLGTVSSEIKTPCCYPKQFTAQQENIITYLDGGTIVAVEETTEMAYDATNERMAQITEAYNAITQVTEKTKIIYDYKKSKEYIIEGTHCRTKSLSYSFAEMCIPPIATYDETVPIGLGKAFLASSFHFLVPTSSPSFNLLVRFSVGAEGCIPYQLGIFAIKAQGPVPPEWRPMTPTNPLFTWVNATVGANQRVSSSFQYINYHDGIEDPSFWFDPPQSCLPGPRKTGDPTRLKMTPILDKIQRSRVGKIQIE